jgi:DNA-binding SARP family transcriptional activator/tetratricopeptide (TPR) repeat protein
MVWFGILGPLLVAGETGGEVPVAGGRLRVLLAALVVRANQVVPVDELAEIIWDGAPPAEAARTVRRYVVRLRRAVGPELAGRIVTRAPGYVCQADGDEVDLLRFEGLCRQGGAAVREGSWPRAARLLGEALELWRGAPLADAESQLLRDAQVPRLEQLRLQALEERIEADLHLGRHRKLVPELVALVGEHPLRERGHTQLMLALYRSGRQGEALAAYQQARRLLVAELGVEPAAELRELHRQILAADPALNPPSPAGGDGTAEPGDESAAEGAGPVGGEVVSRQLPAAIAHFTGRAGAFEALDELAEKAAGGGGGAGGAVVISAIGGTAGIGKTALAVQWGQRNAGLFPGGQLYVNLRGYDPAGVPVDPQEAIQGFLAALGVAPGQVPAGLDAQAGLYRSLVAGRRMLIVLDNARDAGQVRPLLPGSAECLVLITSRDQLTSLVAVDGAHALTLDLLTADEARELLDQRLGARAAAEPAAVGELAALCARLPLALNITAARAIARPGVPLAVLAGELRGEDKRLALLEGGDTAASVRAVFSWSLHNLDAGAARAFRLAGLHPGPDLDCYTAAAVAGTTAEQAAGLLDLLARAHLMHRAGPGRYAMHDLLRAYARELATAQDDEEARQAALTRLLDHYLHTAAAAMDALLPAERHRRPRIPPAESPIPPVADRAAARAWLDAERPSFAAVTAHAAGHGWPGHAAALGATLERYLESGGHYAEAQAVHTSARRAARRAVDRRGEATALNSLGIIERRQGSYGQAADYHQRAFELFREIGDQTGQGRALGNLGIIDLLQGSYQQAADYHQRSFELALQSGDQFGQAAALVNLSDVGWRQGRYQQAVGNLRQALNMFREIGDQTGQAAALTTLGEIAWRQGRYQQATSYLEQALDLARTIGDRYQEGEALNSLGEAFLAADQPGQAQAHHAAALALARETRDLLQQARAGDGLGRACAAIGDRAAARHHWQEALTLYTSLGASEADRVRAQLTTDELPRTTPTPSPR